MTPSASDVAADLAAFRRGAIDLIEEGELERKLSKARAEGRGLRIKFGMDPSSADLHFGHAVVLLKLRDLQELGHTVVLLVGDATAMVGDPSGRNQQRPQLARSEVEENLKTYTEQARLILDMDKTELRFNTEWFDRMGFEDLLALASRMTVAQMIQRDTFKKRMAADEPVGVHEFLYPLMQGWDSVQLEADVELGGSDQLFNLLVGRDMQDQVGQERQVVLTTPLIEGLDGRKMSKSYGNAIGLTDPPNEMFGKTMSIPDATMPQWFELLTRLPEDEVASLLAGHPREAKARLGEELVTCVAGRDAAIAARAAFDRQFVSRELPEDIPEKVFDGDWPEVGLPLPVLLREIGLASSGGEARRLIQQGGVRIEGEVVRDVGHLVSPPDGGDGSWLLQVGKRRFARVSRGE